MFLPTSAWADGADFSYLGFKCEGNSNTAQRYLQPTLTITGIGAAIPAQQ